MASSLSSSTSDSSYPSHTTSVNPTSDLTRPFGHSLPNIGIKLDNTNFLLWKTRFKPFLRAYHMLDVVEGTSLCLSPSDSSHAAIQLWCDSDQLALGGILSTVDDFVTTQLINCNTSHAAWTTLEQTFSQQTRPATLNCVEFDALKKGSSPMNVYLNRAKLLVDNLAAIGRCLSPDELLSRVFHGLGPEYAAFRSMLTLAIAHIPSTSYMLHYSTKRLLSFLMTPLHRQHSYCCPLSHVLHTNCSPLRPPLPSLLALSASRLITT